MKYLWSKLTIQNKYENKEVIDIQKMMTLTCQCIHSQLRKKPAGFPLLIQRIIGLLFMGLHAKFFSYAAYR